MICLLEKEAFELKEESITDGVLSMTWGECRAKRFGCHPGITQLLINKKSGPYIYAFSDYPVNSETIFTIEGLPETIQSIQILVI